MINPIFSDRISDVPKSFIREILKVAISPEMISFAGGLPNRDLFPVKELQDAANLVFETAGKNALQYSNSEGYLPLREYIAKRYADKAGLTISPENILITCGSQQGLDLLAKIILNERDDVLIEEPGYLGAIQVFSVYGSTFAPVPCSDDGLDTEALKKILRPTAPNCSTPYPTSPTLPESPALSKNAERSPQSSMGAPSCWWRTILTATCVTGGRISPLSNISCRNRPSSWGAFPKLPYPVSGSVGSSPRTPSWTS